MGEYYLSVLFNNQLVNFDVFTATLLPGVVDTSLSSCTFTAQELSVRVACTLRDAEGFLLTTYPAPLFVFVTLSNVRNLQYTNFTSFLAYQMIDAGYGVFRYTVPTAVSSHLTAHVRVSDTSQVLEQTFEKDIGFGTLWPQGCIVYAVRTPTWDIEAPYTVSVAVLDQMSNVLCPEDDTITVTLQLEVERGLQKVGEIIMHEE